jgi:hypothetical protein
LPVNSQLSTKNPPLFVHPEKPPAAFCGALKTARTCDFHGIPGISYGYIMEISSEIEIPSGYD